MLSRYRLGVGLVGFTLGMASLMPAGEATLCPAELAERLDSALAEGSLDRAYVGMLVQTQAGPEADGQILYARNADQFFTPASNAKLLTSAAAIHHLGSNYRIRTSVYASPGPGGLTNLRVVGRGDPTLTERQLTDLAQQLAHGGMNRVNQLVLQDAYFPQFATNPTWEWGDAQWYYAPPVNSLILNRNSVTVQIAPTQVGRPLNILWPEGVQSQDWSIDNDTMTVGGQDEAVPLSLWRTGGDTGVRISGQLSSTAGPVSYDLAVLNPGQQFAGVLVRVLGNQGISVAQTEITDRDSPATGDEVAAIESPPLGELLVPTNRDSNNLYAEVLLKTLGVNYLEPPFSDASRAGGEAVAAVLAELGVEPTTIRLADGSGLSRHNLVTPSALVNTLQVMAHHPEAEVFRDSLAVAGVSGTLRNRLRDTPLVGRVQGKSGALTGNVSLSGYMQPPNHGPLVFSILINHSNHHAGVLRDRVDAILLLIAQLSDSC